jgi:cell division septation protein DedD
MAEAKLLSSDADIDVARARLLPPLDLSGAVGHNSLSMSQFFSPSALFWNSISNLTVTIFDAGKLKSDKENAQAIHEEMVENYARTIYQATREVESALASIRLTENRLSSQKDATASARLAWDTSAKVYALGGLDYQTLLDSEHNYHNYLTQYLQIKTDSFHGYISLFQALGGGVKFVKPIPGKGDRPTSILSTASNPMIQKAATPFFNTQQKDIPNEGVDWVGNITSKIGGAMQVENFWQVELPGLYHQSTIGATWRDLKTRYPKLMENRSIRPHLDGTIENSPDGQLALYRLYVSKFESPEAAHEMCFALKANFQRCRVVSSRSDDEVPEPALSKQNTESISASTTPKIAEKKATESVLVSEVLKPALQNINDLPSPVGLKTISANVDRVSENVNNQKQAYTVQLDAFTDPVNAANSDQFWKSRKYNVYVSETRNASGETRYGVRTGLFQSKRDAITLALMFKRKEDQPAAVVKTSLDSSGNPVSIDINKLRALASTATSLSPTKSSAIPMAATTLPPDITEQHNASKEKPVFTVQLGIFTTEGNALKSLEKWKNRGLTAYIIELKNDDNSSRFVIRTGRFTEMQEASEVMRSLRRTEGIRATLVTVEVARADAPVEIKPSLSGQVSVTDIPKTAKSSNNG